MRTSPAVEGQKRWGRRHGRGDGPQVDIGDHPHGARLDDTHTWVIGDCAPRQPQYPGARRRGQPNPGGTDRRRVINPIGRRGTSATASPVPARRSNPRWTRSPRSNGSKEWGELSPFLTLKHHLSGRLLEWGYIGVAGWDLPHHRYGTQAHRSARTIEGAARERTAGR